MLDAELLLNAYCRGIFPMAMNPQGRIGWFSPDPRGIIPLDERFHVSHGLRRVLKRGKFEVTFDRDFQAVMEACAQRKEGTWISPQIIKSYVNLHHLGHAHSVETWLDGKLAGGLYGVHIGGAFFGESMFHQATDASKVALVALVQRLRAQEFVLLDTQWITPHLAGFGAYEISRREYLWRLQKAVKLDCSL
jgi:leucyl/phenylalanyl-tRNA--protein transferase